MKAFSTALLAALTLSFTAALHADTLDDIMEKARAKGGEYAKARRILNEEPDQNVRLAVFNYIVAGDDPTLKAIAIDAGLASTDRILQSHAFLTAVMDLEAIHLELSDAADAKGEKPTNLKNYIKSNGKTYIVTLHKRDLAKATFEGKGYLKGEVTGVLLNLDDYSYTLHATLELLDDDKVQGELTMYGYKFIATGRLR